ncbi:hypothetical protein [Coxiella endosymbiont of Amblyomma americanum]|nr:hypothetical protein [Coxiella endosymbiont of Amblyomma americanum]
MEQKKLMFILIIKSSPIKGICEELKDIIFVRRPLVISIAVGVSIRLIQK